MMSCSKEPSEGGSGEAENFSVAFEVSDVTASSAVISFSPSSQTLPYIAGYVSSSDLGPSDIKYFIDNEISLLMEQKDLDRAMPTAIILLMPLLKHLKPLQARCRPETFLLK